MKKLHALLLSPLAFSLLQVSSANALVSSANTGIYLGVNYGEEVLNAVLANWKNPDPTVTGVTSVTVRVAKDGRPYSCEIRKNSSSEIVDNSICQTVANIGQFPPLEGLESGEVFLSFVHDNKPYLEVGEKLTKEEKEVEEEVDTVKNPISSPIKEINKSTNIKLDTETIEEENIPLQNETSLEKSENQKNTNNPEPITNNEVNKNTSANEPVLPPVTDKEQPQTLVISREEALQPPSKNLVDPSYGVKEYSSYVLQEAAQKFRFPSNIKGKYEVVARIDLLANGTLEKATINKSSNNTEIDKEVLRVLTKEIHYKKLPNNSNQSLWLTFNITK